MKNVTSAGNRFNSFVLIFLVCFGSVSARAQQPTSKAITPTPRAAKPPSSDLIQPAELATILKAAEGDKPLIFHVGSQVLYTQAHIPGSEYIGPSSSPEDVERLRKRAESLPRTQFIVLYCGCCPWGKCPNVTPACNEFRRMGFKKLKILYIANDFGTDWAEKGYPVTKGEQRATIAQAEVVACVFLGRRDSHSTGKRSKRKLSSPRLVSLPWSS